MTNCWAKQLEEMGAYLRKPVTEKSSTHGEHTVCGLQLQYAATAMQGWRVSMEDAHSIIPELDSETSLFAVYDGHGGKEVALYSALHLPDLITSSESYKSQNLEQALKNAFMLCDRQVLGEEAVAEMKSMLQDSMEEEESSGDESAKLLQEAERPLETILAKYRMLGRTLMREEMEKGSTIGSNQERIGASVESRSASELFLQLLGGEIKDSDSSEEEEQGEKEEEEEEEEEEGEGVEEEKEEKKGQGEEDEQEEEQSEIDGDADEAEDISLDRDAKSTHKPSRCITKPSCDANTKDVGGSRTQLKDGGKAPEENSAPSSLTNCNSDDKNGSQNSPLSCGVDGNCKAKIPASTNSNLESTNEITSSTTSQSTHRDSDSSGVDATRGKGLLDLLTSSIQDRFPRTPTMETHEELTSRNASTERSPSAVMEAYLPPISPFVRASRKRPHSDDYDDQQEELESPKRLCRPVIDDEGYHSGTTAVVCLLRGKSLVVANAGDSRCVLAHKGTAVDMSLDHKPTDNPELERILRAGGQVGADSRVNGGLNLSRAIGDHFYKENQSLPLEEQMITAMPDVRMRTITEDDEFFVVACDGIWNSMSSQEVVDFVRTRLAKGNRNPEELTTICEALCDACLAVNTDNDGTGCDNMTCMIVLLSQSNSQKPS